MRILRKPVDTGIRVAYICNSRSYLSVGLKMTRSHEDTKRERFRRLATQRTNAILKRLKILGNCANRSAYEYAEDEVNKIFSEIEKRVREVRAQFHFPRNKEFKL